jgi:hypothetical protein
VRGEKAFKEYSYAKAVRPADYMYPCINAVIIFVEDVLDQGQLGRMNDLVALWSILSSGSSRRGKVLSG